MDNKAVTPSTLTTTLPNTLPNTLPDNNTAIFLSKPNVIPTKKSIAPYVVGFIIAAIVAIIVIHHFAATNNTVPLVVDNKQQNQILSDFMLPMSGPDSMPNTSSTNIVSTNTTSTGTNNISTISKPANASIANLDLINSLAQVPATGAVTTKLPPSTTTTQPVSDPIITTVSNNTSQPESKPLTVPQSDLINALAAAPSTAPISTTPIIPTTSYHVVNNMDYPSFDIFYYEGAFDQCEPQCNQTNGCVGYVLDKVNQKNCWLKSRLAPPGNMDSNKDTYYKARNYTYKPKTNYTGDILKYYVGSFDTCEVACDNTAGCVGYTKHLDNGANCWLKKTVGDAEADDTRDTYLLQL